MAENTLAHLDLTRSMRMPSIMSRKGWMCTGYWLTVSVSAASRMSYGRPSKMPSSRSSHRSSAYAEGTAAQHFPPISVQDTWLRVLADVSLRAAPPISPAPTQRECPISIFPL